MESILVNTKNLGRNPRSIYHGLTHEQMMEVKKIEKQYNIRSADNIMIIIDAIRNADINIKK